MCTFIEVTNFTVIFFLFLTTWSIHVTCPPSIDARACFVSKSVGEITEVVPYAEVYKELTYFLKRIKKRKQECEWILGECLCALNSCFTHVQ